MLEDSLRQALSEQVELTPAATGRADAVIRRGRAASKRRRVYTGLAAVLSFAMLIVGVTFWQTLVRPAGSMTFSADPTALPQPAPTASIDERSPPAASIDERSAPAASTDERPVPVESIDLALVAGIGLDLRVGNRLLTADGRRLDLVGVGDVDRVVPRSRPAGSTVAAAASRCSPTTAPASSAAATPKPGRSAPTAAGSRTSRTPSSRSPRCGGTSS